MIDSNSTPTTIEPRCSLPIVDNCYAFLICSLFALALTGCQSPPSYPVGTYPYQGGYYMPPGYPAAGYPQGVAAPGSYAAPPVNLQPGNASNIPTLPAPPINPQASMPLPYGTPIGQNYVQPNTNPYGTPYYPSNAVPYAGTPVGYPGQPAGVQLGSLAPARPFIGR